MKFQFGVWTMVKIASLKLCAAFVGLSILSGMSSALAETPLVPVDENPPVVVTIDRAKVFRISSPAATVIIGNPSIADATVEDDVTLVLTGRSFGVTNLIVLDRAGNPIVDETIVVRGHEGNTVRIYRRDERVTLACAPVCEPTLTIGDNSQVFEYAQEQITARNSLSESAK
jgi:hypothetical protein